MASVRLKSLKGLVVSFKRICIPNFVGVLLSLVLHFGIPHTTWRDRLWNVADIEFGLSSTTLNAINNARLLLLL